MFIPSNWVLGPDPHQIWQFTFWQEDFCTLSCLVVLWAWMSLQRGLLCFSQTYSLCLFIQINKQMGKKNRNIIRQHIALCSPYLRCCFLTWVLEGSCLLQNNSAQKTLLDFARSSACYCWQLGHTEAQTSPCWEWQVCWQAAWHAEVLGLAMLKGMVKFPAGSLRPGAVTALAEESPAHHEYTVVRFLSSLLVSCSASVNLGHFYFSSNSFSDKSCTQKCSSWSTTNNSTFSTS